MERAMAIAITELNGANCKTYLLSSGTKAALIDPVRERLETYRKALAERGLELALVLETHMHADHLMLNREAKEALGAPVLAHQASPSPVVDRHVVEGDELRLGEDLIRVWHTPGHTPDSVCYLIDGAIFTGDTMLIGGSGRTDLPGGDPGHQFDAVTKRLFALPDDTTVWPGHDYKGRASSTIGAEKRENPRFVGKTRAQYIEMMNNLGLPLPDKIQHALQVNQSGVDADEVTFPLVAHVASLQVINAKALSEWVNSATPPVVLDVREPEEFTGELGHVQGALLVPLDVLERRLPKLAGYIDRDVVVVCRAGARSATAGAMLERAGFRCIRNLAGGMLAWHAAGLDVQR
jgi:sulfur dioxygenase